MSDFWSWYLNEEKPSKESTVDIIERSLTFVKNDPNASADELTENAKRIYRLACGRDLNNSLDECVKEKMSDKRDDMNSFSFSIERFLMFFNKSRSLIMSVAMLALLIGFSLKGEFPRLVFVFILSFLLFYLIKEFRGYRSGHLVKEQISTSLEDDCYKEVVSEALSKIKRQKNVDFIEKIDQQDYARQVKYFFDQHSNEQSKKDDVASKGDDGDLKLAKRNYLWTVFWNNCQDSIEFFKSENTSHRDLNLEALNKEIDNDVSLQQRIVDEAVEVIKNKRDAEMDSLKEGGKVGGSNYLLRRDIYNKYKKLIKNAKDENKERVLIIKSDFKNKVKSSGLALKRLNRGINKSIPHIRVMALEAFDKRLDGRDGIPTDEVNYFHEDLDKDFNTQIKKQLSPYHYSVLEGGDTQHGDDTNV